MANKNNYAEASAYLQKFVDSAPNDHPLKASAKDALDFLKQPNQRPAPKTDAELPVVIGQRGS